MNKSILAFIITILLFGVSIQSSIATDQPEKEIDIKAEPKEYLFQTIIDMSNNLDIKGVLEKYNHNLFFSDYDYKDLFSKLLFRNPRLLFNILFSKPSITYEYLSKCYNKGIEITSILGEDIALEIINSIEVIDIELLDELDIIFLKNDELSSKIDTLKEMNKELNPDFPFDKHPIICSILGLMFIYEVAKFGTFYSLFLHFENTNLIISYILKLIATKSILFVAISYVLLEKFQCIVIDWDP
jgi:hypothetical protein